MLALKLFTGDGENIYKPVLNVLKAYPNQCGIEVAFYNRLKEYERPVIDAVKKLDPSMISWHSYHGKIGFDAFWSAKEATTEWFEWELAQAREFGVKRMIIHQYANRESAPDLPPVEVALSRWRPGLEYIISKGVVPYFENTFENIDWVRNFYDLLSEEGYAPYMGFCLDIGHVRAYGDKTLLEWEELVDSITARGFKLHYHIHANDGSGDQHIALHLAHTKELLGPSPEWAPQGLEDWLKRRWTKKEGDTLLLLEHSSSIGEESFEFTKFMIES